MNSRVKLIGRLLFWPVFLWVVFIVTQNPAMIRYRVTDWWRLRDYEAPAVITEIAESAALTGHATNILYASQPELDNKTVFNSHCPFPEQSFVLGCYDGDRIYILDIETPELESAESVTAAHEMLHAAWARLPVSEQNRLRKLLDKEFASNDDPHLREIIAKYQEAGNDAETIVNELHSIIPTEVREISPELETYYDKYFTNREELVKQFESYEAVFAANEAELEMLESQASDLIDDIRSQEQRLNLIKQVVDANNTRLEAWSQSSNIQAYNALVRDQKAVINSYNALVGRYNENVDKYQNVIERYQELAFYQNELVNAINSKAEVID